VPIPIKKVESDDPMELQGVACGGDPDVMISVIITEYLHDGWTAENILKLFSDPFYPTLHQAYLRKGADAIQAQISDQAKSTGVFNTTTTETEEPIPMSFLKNDPRTKIIDPKGADNE
jgi:hypothetical protein